MLGTNFADEPVIAESVCMAWLAPPGQHSLSPVTGFSAQVHDRDNKQRVMVEAVKNGIRKGACAAGADVLLDLSPTPRSFENSTDRGFHLQAESRSKTWPTRLIECGGFAVLQARLRVKIICHRSPADQTADLSYDLLPRYWLYPTRPNLISAPNCLSSPKPLNRVWLSQVQALHDLVRQHSS